MLARLLPEHIGILEGIFLGWPEERLSAGYAALMPMDEPPPPETLQLG